MTKSKVEADSALERFPAKIAGVDSHVISFARGEDVVVDGEVYPMIDVVIKKTGVRGAKPVTISLSAALLAQKGATIMGQDYSRIADQASDFGKQAAEAGAHAAGRIANAAVAVGTPIVEDLKDQAGKFADTAKNALDDWRAKATGKGSEESESDSDSEKTKKLNNEKAA